MPDLLYKAYRIRLLSQFQQGVWYPEALVLTDTATGSIGTPIYDTQAYLLKDEADGRALTLAKAWVDKQKV
jgi:hypothetical protein